ncbi:response regulator [Cohnella ginsengisoli]|uniref:Response regulator n=1 Tax=Cohnella ginsengisoli TaxID=425004 RepID=A0A9X4KEY7_9BACL|nr:response regulator [Cohnella ginsengisoli]MDG0790546.1 response regulator [Cohnella ginsengisoli]
MNVLIVEDETQIRSSLEDALRRFGIDDIRIAGHGLEALALLEERRADLILSDIRMPEMDGIALLERVRERHGDVLFIVLSGYDLFEYAQKALKWGAYAYLLKPVAEAELEDVIRNALQELMQKRDLREDELRLQIKLNAGTSELRRRFLTEIVEGKEASGRQARKCEEYGIQLPYSSHYIWLAGIDEAVHIAQTMPRSDIELLKYGLENLCLEVLREGGLIAEPFRWDDGVGLVLNGGGMDGSGMDGHGMDGQSADRHGTNGRGTDEKIVALSERAAGLAIDVLKLSLTVGIGRPVGRLEETPASYASARRAYAQKLVHGGGRVYVCGSERGPGSDAAGLDLAAERELLALFEAHRQDEASAFIAERFAPFRVPCSFEIADIAKLNYRLIVLLATILRQLGFDADEALGDEYHLYTQVNALQQMEEMVAWFRQRLSDAFAHIEEKSTRSTKKLMGKARDYIAEHFHEAISLELVADHLQISPEYLSREFKKEHGENFTDFLLRLRMEKAKSYIREGRYRTYEIANLVGFQNEKYFSKVFKKSDRLYAERV